MNFTAVPNPGLEALSAVLDDLTPQVRKAARHVMENPRDIGFSTVREAAEAAGVKPNTMVRMARQAGFDGYDEFREHFREAIRSGGPSLSGRARWLQDVQRRGGMGELYAQMAESALRNIEATFAAANEADLQAAAQALWKSRNVFTLGVGVNHANASNFSYLASTGMTDFHAIPRPGSTGVDDLAGADGRDSLIAITCAPYRTEVVEAVQIAKAQGIKIIALSDSPVSPIVRAADYGFVISTETPQFFPSSVSTIALLETLLSFVIAMSSEDVAERVEQFHNRRHQLGLYHEDVT
ncbi:MurR/RpiR family transcriptional regulator [Cribrihabitans pelagius]|uniref:MurR/RpiR family transcriptional regulator n=1 Tax=Cribrihabitans pelagius TaxID=1765746 RepID=UPI003B5B6A5A